MKLKITNPDKVLYPKQKITKLDVINYYMDISRFMLPYVKNRLISVIRCHDNIEKEKFFKKHPTTDKDMVETYLDGDEEYFYISNQTQLVYQAQMGTLEFHTWGSLVHKIEKPNIMVFDLDPDEKLPLNKLRMAVLKAKTVLDVLNLKSYLKTSGGKGYHILVPFNKNKGWDEFYEISKQIALLLENKWPKIFTTNIKKAERKNKIFVDYLRNNRGSTCVAPYSLRARDGASISFPISWDDLNKIKPSEITIKNYTKYINNAWKDFCISSSKIID